MLTCLRIKNFAIVAELELDFSAGMTAFTGETGAGKSIMIDALMLALGERADINVIRPGQQTCDIQASFSYVAHSEPAAWLAAHDLPCEDSQIVLRRLITLEGRSKSYINGVAFPLQKVKELSETLVHIHGQHQHQTLLAHPTHRQQLDNYANHTELSQDVLRLYRTCQQLEEERRALTVSDPHQLAYLSAQIEELQQLSPITGEIEALHKEHQLLHHAQDYLETTQHIHQCIDTDDGPSIRHNLHIALQGLAALPQDNAHITSAKALLENANMLCDEALDDLNSFATQVQLDPERLMQIETRMSAMHHFARKYHIEVSRIDSHLQSLTEKQTTLLQEEQRKTTLEQEYATAKQQYLTAALNLRASRQQHAKTLAAHISKNIQQLGMPHGFIDLVFTPLDTMHAHGMDKIEYQVSTNPGMKPDLLSKIASGGELSRISLAIQMIAAQQGATPTLLFDEVDVGIGGATAAIVGQLLRTLGERLQVFCVTHQPQVAACAHQHFEVKKHTDKEQTFSNIVPLTKEQRIEEIARMLGGLTITQQTRSHAKELLTTLGCEPNAQPLLTHC